MNNEPEGIKISGKKLQELIEKQVKDAFREWLEGEKDEMLCLTKIYLNVQLIQDLNLTKKDVKIIFNFSELLSTKKKFDQNQIDELEESE